MASASAQAGWGRGVGELGRRVRLLVARGARGQRHIPASDAGEAAAACAVWPLDAATAAGGAVWPSTLPTRHATPLAPQGSYTICPPGNCFNALNLGLKGLKSACAGGHRSYSLTQKVVNDSWPPSARRTATAAASTVAQSGRRGRGVRAGEPRAIRCVDVTQCLCFARSRSKKRTANNKSGHAVCACSLIKKKTQLCAPPLSA